MWSDLVVPRLRTIGIGTEVAARTYRLTGIGESQVAHLLGEALLRADNPIVATYARTEAVDVRISAFAAPPRSADQLVDDAAATVLAQLEPYVWATGETTWSEAIGARLAELGWSLAAVEIGTGGSLSTLFGDATWFRFAEITAPEAPAARPDEVAPAAGPEPDHETEPVPDHDLVRFARRARELGDAEVGVAVRTRPRTGDLAVSIAVSTPAGDQQATRVVFLTGPLGRSRSALATAAFLFETLRAAIPDR